VLVAGYQVVQATHLTMGYDIRLGDARVLVFRDGFEYFTAPGWEIREIDNENFEFRLGPINRTVAPDGVYLLVVTPHDGHALERVSVAAPLAAAVLGSSTIYRPLFTNVISRTAASVQIMGPAFAVPKNFLSPSLEPQSVQRYKDAYLAIEASADKARIELSLRWFEEAHHRLNEDALLRYWIAIETLAMPDTTNIRPAEELLADAYGMTIATIRSEIELGRLFNLRGDIAHNGLRSALDPRLLNFVAAVYADLLEAMLGLPCSRRASAVKATIGPSIAPLTPRTPDG
jgi:Apea-like HEPN